MYTKIVLKNRGLFNGIRILNDFRLIIQQQFRLQITDRKYIITADNVQTITADGSTYSTRIVGVRVRTVGILLK